MKNLYGYDMDKNLTKLDIDFNGEVLAQNRYAYDSNGNRTIKTTDAGAQRIIRMTV
mgnify:CR=1 FL=1